MERELTYPLGDGDAFRIDHGADYARFFTELGEAHFVLACEGDAVVGIVAAVVRSADTPRGPLNALYVCDYKVAPRWRARGLGKRLLGHGLWTLLRTPSLRGTRLWYGVAMQGERGDVMRSARRVNPLRLASPMARCHVYFIPAPQLRQLSAAPPLNLPHGRPLMISAALPPLVRTAGRKDLRRVSNNEPLPFVHLTTPPHDPHWSTALQAAVAQLADTEVACFALDIRLVAHHAWLAQHQLLPATACTVYAVTLTPARPGWLHLATCDI